MIQKASSCEFNGRNFKLEIPFKSFTAVGVLTPSCNIPSASANRTIPNAPWPSSLMKCNLSKGNSLCPIMFIYSGLFCVETLKQVSSSWSL